jgi:hypothetical protein
MILPKGASYKFIWTTDGRALLSTKTTSLDSLMEQFASNEFSGYMRITVENKDRVEDGYLLLSYGKAIGAEFLGKKTLLSEAGLKGIREAWKLEGIIDLYEFNDVQLKLSIEENVDALFLPLEKILGELEKAKLKAKKKPKIEDPTPVKISEDSDSATAQETTQTDGDRTAILEKFGLKDPSNEFAESILKGLSLPSDRELSNVARKLKLGIVKELNKKKRFKDLDLYITPLKTSDVVEFTLDFYVKPIQKDTEEKVKSAIGKTMKESLDFPYKTSVKIMPPN